MITLISQTRPQVKANQFPKWQPATWENYLVYRDDSKIDDRVRLFFNDNYLLVDMGNEGINHARVSDLFTLLFGFWFSYFTDKIADSLGRCLLQKPNTQAASPDLVLYIGEGVPQWQEGEPRLIDLSKWRVPNLVGEVGDTTLATDLDEKKKLYANLGIPEYWVIDVKAQRVFAFILQENGSYQQVEESMALAGLPIVLLEETLERLNQGTNINAASWFAQNITTLSAE
jgi:Uma2 family endonuclease